MNFRRNKNEFDMRQLFLMKTQIDNFEKGLIDLFSLQSSLEFLFHQIRFRNEKWEQEFLEEITTLEIINAGLENPPTNLKSIVDETIKKIKNLLEKALFMIQ